MHFWNSNHFQNKEYEQERAQFKRAVKFSIATADVHNAVDGQKMISPFLGSIQLHQYLSGVCNYTVFLFNQESLNSTLAQRVPQACRAAVYTEAHDGI